VEDEEVKEADSFDQLIRQQSYYHNQATRGSKGKAQNEFAMDVIKARSRNAMLMSGGTTSNGSKESAGNGGGSFKRTRVFISSRPQGT